MKTKRKSSRAIQRRGATTVEMAVVVPLFFLFAFALIEFSRISMVKQSLTDAAQAGCRKAALATTLDQQDVTTTVRNHLQSVLADATQVGMCNVTISHSDLGNVERGTEITTTVEVNCSNVSWITPNFGEDVMIRAASTMKRE
jgi:Flp pilus assembly protein TadG